MFKPNGNGIWDEEWNHGTAVNRSLWYVSLHIIYPSYLRDRGAAGSEMGIWYTYHKRHNSGHNIGRDNVGYRAATPQIPDGE